MANTAYTKNWFHTAMLMVIVAFSGGSFTLLWNDHEKIWNHEVRIMLLESGRDTKKTTSTSITQTGILPKKIKEETLKCETY
jgi:hypothetical protein